VISRILCPFHHACYDGFKNGFLFCFFPPFQFLATISDDGFSLIVLRIHRSWDTWVFGDWEMEEVGGLMGLFLGALETGRVRKV
jgi:hypothetical protein